jgi:hypothetical protein
MQLTAPYARFTTRLNQALERIGLALAGRAGARLAAQLGLGAGDEGTYDEDAATFRPWMIIKCPTHSIDQLRQAFSAVRRGMSIVQPGLQGAGVVKGNVDQGSPAPCPEVTFA